jgi:hypothetical protein
LTAAQKDKLEEESQIKMDEFRTFLAEHKGNVDEETIF